MTELKLIVDSIIWGYLDSERRIYEDSLQTMIVVIESIRSCDSQIRQDFYGQFLVYIIQHTLYVKPRRMMMAIERIHISIRSPSLITSDCLTDRMHIPVLPQLSKLLRLLFTILTSTEVTVPLVPSAQTCYQNASEVGNLLVKYLVDKFPQCSPNLIYEYVLALENASRMTDQKQAAAGTME